MERKGMTGFMSVVVNAFMVIGLWGCADSRHEMYDSIPDLGEWEPIENYEELDNYWRVERWMFWLEADVRKWSSILKNDEIKGADCETFEVCRGTQYAKDKNKVYYPRHVWCNYIDIGNTPLSKIDIMVYSYADEHVVEGASPESFKYIGNGYAIDRKHMYEAGDEIPWNDGIIKKQLELYREGKDIDCNLDHNIRMRKEKKKRRR